MTKEGEIFMDSREIGRLLELQKPAFGIMAHIFFFFIEDVHRCRTA